MLKGKAAILIGSGAIASGYASELAKQKMKIIVVSRGESSEKLALEISGKGSEVIALHADASDFDSFKKMFEKAEKKFGKIDILVNGSGGNRPEATAHKLDDFLNMDKNAANLMMEANYYSKVYATQLFAEHLKRKGHKGSVINIASMSGLVPLSKVIYYSASFAALENFAKSSAFIYGKYKLGRVNNVAVGFLIGEHNKSLLTNPDGSYTARSEEILAATSEHRFVTPEEIAQAVLFLADEEKSKGVNGITLRVDAGFDLVNLPNTGYED